MLMWLKRIFIGCEHTYEPHGKICRYYPMATTQPDYWEDSQSQRCTKCGDIKIFKI